MIEGDRPAVLPSIEDKIVRFAGKDRHPIFVEPCGRTPRRCICKGASSSLPEDAERLLPQHPGL